MTHKISDITKFFGCELGAHVKINTKNSEFTVNGAHNTATLDRLLDVFIKKYVLCTECKLPETDLSVKRRSIYSNCNACGNTSILNYKHRVDIYITKNPPKAKAEKQYDDFANKAAELKIKGDIGEWDINVFATNN